jgi:hypothetical protein
MSRTSASVTSRRAIAVRAWSEMIAEPKSVIPRRVHEDKAGVDERHCCQPAGADRQRTTSGHRSGFQVAVVTSAEIGYISQIAFAPG